MWAKFDCNGGDAYASKSITHGSDWWFEADVWIPSTTFTACSDGDLFGFSAQLLTMTRASGGSFLSSAFIVAEDSSYPSGSWEWGPSVGSPGGTVTTNTSHTIKFHQSGTTLSFFVDGTLITSGTQSNTVDAIKVGGLFADDCECEWYYISNVKVGSTDGGTDIFHDDFSSGDFSNWTSTTGSCSVVSTPTVCSTVASISLDPTSACYGDTVTITGSGFAASTPITVIVGGIAVTFSEADTDGSGNVSGTFTVPPGLPSCGGCSTSVIVSDGTTTASATLDLCCDKSADTINSTSQLGPTLNTTDSIAPLDYIHHDGAHWVVAFNELDSTVGNTFPPDSSYRPLTVYKIPDDGLSLTTYDLDLNYQFTFGKPPNATTFLCQTAPDPLCGVENVYANTIWYFQSWKKSVADARFASDGTTLWLGVISEETVAYPYGTLGDVDLETLTDGYTSFITNRDDAEASTGWDHSTCPPTGGSAYNRLTRISEGLLEFCHTSAYPVDDGGDAYSSNWSPPRVVMFSSTGSGFTRIGTMDAKYCPGDFVSGQSVCTGTIDITTRGAGSFFSGISLAASPAQEGVCHLVWSEGGDWGTYGLAGSDEGGCPIPLIWDGGAPNRDYRIGYSVWGDSSKTAEYDLWSAHTDRTSWFFVPGSGGEEGYNWPATGSLAVSDVFQVRNEAGSPILFLAPAATVESSVDPPDNTPSYPPADTLTAYDISTGSPVSLQTIDSTLIPTSGEVGTAPDVINATFAAGFNQLAALSISDVYTDPLLASTDVYLVALSLTKQASGPPCVGVYRVKDDLSAAFDFLDGIRSVGYSIIVRSPFLDPTLRRTFVSDTENVWALFDSSTGVTWLPGPWQLDRQCLAGWTGYGSVAGLAGVCDGLYFDGAHTIYTVGDYGRSGSIEAYGVTAVNICRGCRTCSCGAAGLHIWQHF